MNAVLLVDIDMVLPKSLRARAEYLSIQENPQNLPPPSTERQLALAAHRLKRWANGRALRICFLDGDPVVQQRVREVAVEWTEDANLTFDFVQYPDAEIRISFSFPGSWSYIGTDALAIAQDAPTMNFGWLQPDSTDKDYSQVVLHEFGHAIGCVHEHQTPIAGIQWNKEAVYTYFLGLETPKKWTREDVDHNIFDVYSSGMTNHSAFDPQSIMVYPIPKAFTLNGFEVPWNSRLSELDKQFIASVYPR